MTAQVTATLSLRARALRAAIWIIVAHGGTQAIRLANNLILTRLLAPELFGIIAVTSSIQIITSLLSDIGLSQAVIQSRRGGEKEFLNTAWTVQIVRGFVIWGGCVCIALGVLLSSQAGFVMPGSVYANECLPLIIVISSTSAIIGGFHSMKATLLSRKLDLRLLTYIELVSSAAGLLISCVAAFFWHSVWAFVSGSLVTAAVATWLSHALPEGPANHLSWDRSAIAEIRSFGKWAFLSSVALAFSMNGDRLLLGLWLSPAELGFYSIASALATLMEGIGNRLFSGLSFPALSEVAREDRARLRSTFLKMRWPSDVGFVWLAGFLLTSSGSIVHLLYDQRYAQAGPMLSILSFSLLLNRYNLAGYVYLAVGRPKWASVLNWAKMGALFVFVPSSYYLFGAFGAILAIALHRAATLPFIFYYDSKLGIVSWKLEATAVVIWLLGWLSGKGFIVLIGFAT